MKREQNISIYLISILIIILFSGTASAGPDWKEKQKLLFEQISVKPGDIIDKSNWKKVKDLLPESIVKWIKNGDFKLNIGQYNYDYDYNEAYYKISAKNKGKYSLGEKKEIIDVSTGKYPMFIRGIPFPDVDVKNDPDGAIKFMHNNNLCLQLNSSYDNFPEMGPRDLQWIGRNGFERGVGFKWEKFYYWNRRYGEIPNPNHYMNSSFLITLSPYDLTGTASLYLRHLDGREDSIFAYVPAIRRIKRLSGANRSDPQMGSDQCVDDSDGWGGHNEAMDWSYVDEKIILKPQWVKDAEKPRKFKKTPNGYEFHLPCNGAATVGYETPNWDGAPWAYVNFVWIPRELWIIKAKPLDPYYAYGALELYLDKLSRLAVYNIKYNRAGEHWKTLCIASPLCVYGDDIRAFNINGPLLVVDDKTNHASYCPVKGLTQLIDTNTVNPARHTPQNLRTATK